jgi:uncharacterized pyridoxamine 5'-phosphate oxidase family protein
MRRVTFQTEEWRKTMLKVELSCDELMICPKCGSQLCQEVLEAEKKVYVVCEESGCAYEATIEYESIEFRFTYRDEFTTEVTARNIEEALKRIEQVNWKRTPYYLWRDYLEARYYPSVQIK